jgi:hypothetical protein
LENAVHGVNGTNFASNVDARDEEKRITLAHKEIRPTPSRRTATNAEFELIYSR